MKRLSLALLLGAALIGPALGVVASTPVGNANYTTLASDQRLLYTVALSAPRTITLVSAGATCIGQTCGASSLEIIDQIGAVTSTNTLTITAASNETINNSTNSITIGEPFGRILLIPTNGSNWQVVIYAPGQYPGTTTNDNAPAGSIGEFITSRTDVAVNQSVTGAANVVTSAPLLTTTVPTNVTQALLTAGDWDCRGEVFMTPSPFSNPTQFASWTSTAAASAATPVPANTAGAVNNHSYVALQAAAVTSPNWALGVPLARYSLAASTSVFLNAVGVFGAGTIGVGGSLDCRRAR